MTLGSIPASIFGSMPAIWSILGSIIPAAEDVAVAAALVSIPRAFRSIPIDCSSLGSIPCSILGSKPSSFGSIPVKVLGSICLGSIIPNIFGSIPRDWSILGSMLANILGSYIEAISLGSIKAAMVLGSIIDSILGSSVCKSLGSTPGNILGSRPANVVLVLALGFVLLPEDLD